MEKEEAGGKKWWSWNEREKYTVYKELYEAGQHERGQSQVKVCSIVAKDEKARLT